MRVPSLGLWAARALAKQGKLLEAADRYAEVTRLEISKGDEEVQRKAQADAETELESTRTLLPTVTILIDGPRSAELLLRVDGVEVSSQLVGEATPLNPGKHQVEVKTAGKLRSRKFTLALGEKRELKFKASEQPNNSVDASEPEPPVTPTAGPASSSTNETQHTRRTLGWVSMGVGAAGLVAGGVTGALVLAKRDSLDATCRDGHCPTSQVSDVDNYNTLRTISTTTFVVGGVFAAAGIVLVLSQPQAEKPQMALRLGPTSAHLELRFQ
jgi:hypothetical protein